MIASANAALADALDSKGTERRFGWLVSMLYSILSELPVALREDVSHFHTLGKVSTTEDLNGTERKALISLTAMVVNSAD